MHVYVQCTLAAAPPLICAVAGSFLFVFFLFVLCENIHSHVLERRWKIVHVKSAI